MKVILINLLVCIALYSCKSEDSDALTDEHIDVEEVVFWRSLTRDHTFNHRAIALYEERGVFKYWKEGEAGMFEDVYRGAGRYEWSEGNTVLTLSNEFGEITLERGLIDDEEVLINTDRPEHRVAKEGWILIRSQHATLKTPLVP